MPKHGSGIKLSLIKFWYRFTLYQMQLIFKLGSYLLHFCICLMATEDIYCASFRLKIWVIMQFSTLAPLMADLVI